MASGATRSSRWPTVGRLSHRNSSFCCGRLAPRQLTSFAAVAADDEVDADARELAQPHAPAVLPDVLSGGGEWEQIKVPFCIESELSGVRQVRRPVLGRTMLCGSAASLQYVVCSSAHCNA